MSGPDASLIPPGPPPLDVPPPVPERRRLRWWMVALGTILIAALVLGAGLALAAVLRDDGRPAANRAPDINLPGGQFGVAPLPIDGVPEVTLPSGSTTTTVAGFTPGPPPTAAPSGPAPPSAPPAPAPQSPPVTNRPPIGPGQIPPPTAAPRCSISNFDVNPDTVPARRNGRDWQLTRNVTVSFSGSPVCPEVMEIRVLHNNVPIKNFQVSREGSAYVYVVDSGTERNGWGLGDHIVQVLANEQFRGALPLEVCDQAQCDPQPVD